MYGLGEGEERGRREDLNSTPGMHRQQMMHVAAYDDIRFAGSRQRQVSVILGIAAFLHRRGGLDPLCSDDDEVENPLSACNGNVPIKFRPKDDLPIFVFDFP